MQSPGSKNNSKKRAEKGPAQRLRQRTAILILLILVLGFGAAVLRLTYLTTVQSSELQESAVDLQLADTTVSAKRGTIYDANGNVLAESASVWQVVMSPVNFKNDKQRQAAAKGLSEIFDLEYNDVLDDTKQQSHYVVVKRRIESDEREKVLELIDTLKKDYSCSGVIQLLDDYKRYYPKNSLASSVIGFTGSDDQGLEGIELSRHRMQEVRICRSDTNRMLNLRTATMCISQLMKQFSQFVKNICKRVLRTTMFLTRASALQWM